MIRTLQKWYRGLRLTPAQVAADELAEADLALLKARTGQEFAASVVTYNEVRCKRLRAFLASLEPKC